MGCDTPYQNPAGLRFVTRVEFAQGDALYNAALADEQVILNIPNGAGPGTLYVGTRDTYASWTVRDTKNLVRETQRAYTGAACWEQLWLEDGGTVSVLLLDRDSLRSYDEDGIQTANQPSPRIFAQWFPATTMVNTFDRLSLLTGPPGTVNPYPLRTLLNPNQQVVLTPPGLCRFITIAADQDLRIQFQNLTAATNPAYELIPSTTWVCRAVPAWQIVVISTGPNIQSADFSVLWNRYPMLGGP